MNDYPAGATPLDPDDWEGLIPNLATKWQLNEFEAQSSLRAEQWARGNARFRGDLLSSSALRRLHKEMLGDTWGWAGTYRRRDTNIGVAWSQIPERVLILC